METFITEIQQVKRIGRVRSRNRCQVINSPRLNLLGIHHLIVAMNQLKDIDDVTIEILSAKLGATLSEDLEDLQLYPRDP